jgi:Holliday junction resolvase RusA-like endonuclease
MYLKAEAKRLREEIEDIVIQTLSEGGHNLNDIKNEVPLKVEVYIHESWYANNGNVRRTDVANREKFLLDSVFNALGIDDKFIFSHTMIKVDSEEELAVVSIEVL